jgi:UDPglucose--hexose-1-phosphate uridylyltransferase
MAHEPTVYAMHQTRVAMPDDRVLTYYDFAPRDVQPPYLESHQGAARQNPPQRQRVLDAPPELRWNPTLCEWVVVAANRMSRPMLPAKNACPLCPGVLELALPYQIAIFENRAPAMAYIPGDETLPDTPHGFGLKAPSRGRCDIVVYSQDHNSKLAQMPVNDILCLVEAWRARYAELMALPEVQFVSIFENKGRDAGMTLDHPHGQIYALSFLPTLARTQWEQTQAFSTQGDDLWQRVIGMEERDQVRIIAQTDGFLAAMPFYARYPYEVHIWARRQGVSSLLEMTPQERRELAAMLKNVTCRYENLWPEAAYGFPTLMLMQQMSKLSGVERFRFHIEFLPLQRSPDKLKYRASPESGIGAFLNDALPETQAQELRDIEPREVELPTVVFEDV